MNPSRGTVYYAIQCDYNFLVCGTNSRVWPFKWKLLYWRWQLHLTPYTSHLCKKLLCSSTGLHIMQGIVGILDHTMPERTQAKLHHGSVVQNLKATRGKEEGSLRYVSRLANCSLLDFVFTQKILSNLFCTMNIISHDFPWPTHTVKPLLSRPLKRCTLFRNVSILRLQTS